MSGGEPVGAGLDLGRAGIGAGRQKIGPAAGSRSLPLEQDNLLQGRQLFPLQQLRVAHAQELADSKQPAGTAAAQDEAGFGTLEPRVQGHQHAADALGADGGDHPLPDIGGPDGDALALLETRGQERARGFDAGRIQLRIGQGDITVDHGDMPGQGRRRGGDDLGQGTLWRFSVGHGCRRNN